MGSVRACECACEAQKANEGGIDSLMPPLRKRVQGQIAHSLYHTFSLAPSQSFATFSPPSFTQFSLPVGYLAIHSLRSIRRLHPALHTQSYTHTQGHPQKLQLVAKPQTKSN